MRKHDRQNAQEAAAASRHNSTVTSPDRRNATTSVPTSLPQRYTFRPQRATVSNRRLQVELQDAQGKPLPGFSLDHCEEMFGDSLDRTVQWTPKANLSPLIGQPVRVRFVLRDANLYSFQFRH